MHSTDSDRRDIVASHSAQSVKMKRLQLPHLDHNDPDGYPDHWGWLLGLCLSFQENSQFASKRCNTTSLPPLPTQLIKPPFKFVCDCF